ncbi:excinuclease ABC subunit UvrC [Criibacterium bergeronii]|uniref:UvrABC system protein C n=1 Tax=Criibacterium bergeronii TaxID=1871336 RepID=A0A371IJM2_9FIRM|nr:excinuclease ABC subunit UvrC [Criibacterium bergeronii]
MTDKLKALIKNLPESSGVYLMKDANKNIIYVGKAKVLKNRVRQYFQSQSNMQSKVRAMVSHIDEFEYIVTNSEMEALILENVLIKRYKPKYNILLRDDKTYPYIKVTVQEDFPRVIKTRRLEKDGAKYFGPYSNAFVVSDMIELIHSAFKIRTCKRDILKSIEKKERPCLNYYIKTCDGPCLGTVSRKKYDDNIAEVIEFLKGKNDDILQNLVDKMKYLASKQEFEEAAIVRDKIDAMKTMLEKQQIVSAIDTHDKDYVAISKKEDLYVIYVFFVRGGKVVGTEHFFFEKEENTLPEVLMQSFLKQYYLGKAYVPKSIFTNIEFEDMELLSTALSQKGNTKIEIKMPIKGEKKSVMEMVEQNAQEALLRNLVVKKEKNSKLAKINEELRATLNLEIEPRKIESYDISNIYGVDSVGGQVVFVDGKKAPKLYRRYKIKTVQGPDDYSSMKEIISRRLKHGEYPDLILLDGGKGHVSVIRKLLFESGVDIPVFGMYKDDHHKTLGLCSDTREYEVEKHSALYVFISSIQEEVHRFAINYHKSLRDKKMGMSALDDISGVGAKRKMAIFKHFKSIDKIKNATLEELLEAGGIDKRTAKNIFEHFHGNKV